MYKFNKIKDLQNEGFNISQISKKLDLDWKTVERYFHLNEPPIPKKRVYRTRIDPLEGFYDQIDHLFTIDELKTTDIFTDLKLKGCNASYDTIRRYFLRKNEGKIKKERFFEQEYEPGFEMQVDFKEDIEVKIENKTTMVHLFFSSLPYSSKIYVKAFPGLNFECFADGLASSYEYFEGIPQRVRQDNLKPCIHTILKGRSRRYTEKYLKFIEYYDYEVSACNPARGNEKGHVERDIQTFSHKIKSRLKIEGKHFENYNELNQWLISTIELLQPEVIEKFNIEKVRFKKLRSRNYDVETCTEFLTVSKFGTIRLNKSVYSVPDGYIESIVRVVISSLEVKIYNIKNSKLIATHNRLKDNSESIKLEHVVGSLVQKPGALIFWKHKNIIFEDIILLKFYDQLKKHDPYNAEKVLLQILNLVQHVTLEEIKISIELWLENPTPSAFNFVRSLTVEERRPTLKIEQEKIDPNLNIYDKLLQGEINHAHAH